TPPSPELSPIGLHEWPQATYGKLEGVRSFAGAPGEAQKLGDGVRAAQRVAERRRDEAAVLRALGKLRQIDAQRIDDGREREPGVAGRGGGTSCRAALEVDGQATRTHEGALVGCLGHHLRAGVKLTREDRQVAERSASPFDEGRVGADRLAGLVA